MKYTIIASALSGNKGAASMLEASIQLLDDDEAEFVLLSVYPKQDRALNTHRHLEVVDASPLRLGLIINPLSLLYRLLPFAHSTIGKLSPAVRHIAESDAFLDQGGITFSDGREKYLIYNVASILPPIFLGVPVIKCAQALGPFKGRVNRKLSAMILPRVKLIVARGERTEENLADLQLQNTQAGVDLAFAMVVEDLAINSAEQRFRIRELADHPGMVVGVSPSQVVRTLVESDGHDYVSLMTQFMNLALENPETRLVLAPHSVRPDQDKLHNNDLPLCRQIHAGVKDKDRVLFIDEEATAQELRHIISFCDVFVASRFHAMISALSTGVPPLVIGWSHKYQEVLRMFDMESAFLPYEALQSAHEMNQQLDQQLAIKDQTRAQIESRLPSVIARARQHKDWIHEAATTCAP